MATVSTGLIAAPPRATAAPRASGDVMRGWLRFRVRCAKILRRFAREDLPAKICLRRFACEDFPRWSQPTAAGWGRSVTAYGPGQPARGGNFTRRARGSARKFPFLPAVGHRRVGGRMGLGPARDYGLTGP